MYVFNNLFESILFCFVLGWCFFHGVWRIHYSFNALSETEIHNKSKQWLCKLKLMYGDNSHSDDQLNSSETYTASFMLLKKLPKPDIYLSNISHFLSYYLIINSSFYKVKSLKIFVCYFLCTQNKVKWCDQHANSTDKFSFWRTAWKNRMTMFKILNEYVKNIMKYGPWNGI